MLLTNGQLFPDLSGWAQHLDKPFVLIGFVLFLMILLIGILIKRKRLPEKNVSGAIFCFLASAIIVVISLLDGHRGDRSNQTGEKTFSTTQQPAANNVQIKNGSGNSVINQGNGKVSINSSTHTNP